MIKKSSEIWKFVDGNVTVTKMIKRLFFAWKRFGLCTLYATSFTPIYIYRRAMAMFQYKLVFFMIRRNSASLISPSPSLSASSIISWRRKKKKEQTFWKKWRFVCGAFPFRFKKWARTPLKAHSAHKTSRCSRNEPVLFRRPKSRQPQASSMLATWNISSQT